MHFAIAALSAILTSIAAAEPITLFVFAGQSNMVGGNALRHLETTDATILEEQPDVLFTFYINKIQDDDGWGPLRPTKGLVGGSTWGPDTVFGNLYHDIRPDHSIAVIKTAHSGTSLFEDWLPGSGPRLLESLDYISRSITQLENMGHEVEAGGIFWVQGFADSSRIEAAEVYGENLANLAAAFRETMGDPNTPFFFTRQHVSTRRQGEPLDVMRAQQEAFAASDPNAYMIDIDDLAFRDDFVHYDAEATYRIGTRFVEAYLAAASVPTPGALALLGLVAAHAARRQREQLPG